MARTRTQEAASEEWSCPLCTLLNTPEDNRCAACDNARPPVDQLRNSQPSEQPTANATASEVQHIYRPAAGVFFSSILRNQSDSGADNTWKQEPRLVVNRRRGIRRRNVIISAETNVDKEKVETGYGDRIAGSTAEETAEEEETKVVAQVPATTATLDSIGMMDQAEEKQEMDEEDTGIDVEEPSFNLLGSGGSVFAAPPVQNTVEYQCTADETKSREESEKVGFSDGEDVTPTPPKYPGFMPASKVIAEETRLEEKLASAGLDLSDSEDEDKPKMLRRRSEDEDISWEDKWVCQICTSLNDQTVLECSSCKCKRYRFPVEALEPTAEANLQWACHICTNLNPPDTPDCLMCLSTRKSDTKTTDRRWKCSVCAAFNESGAVRCELCDHPREEAAAKVPGKQGPQCSVCTNINPPGTTRCELCDSSLLMDEEDEEDQFVDLSSSPPGRKSSYVFDEDDLENPYADLSQYDNDYNAPNEVADADLDYVEEISDNEQPSNFLTNPRPVPVRAELKEFENFVSMEDLRRDYGCRINFNQMFAGQRSGKSYSDRLATRRAASRKRKRTAAQIESGELPASAARKGKKKKTKAAKGGKKRKAPTAGRRASEGGAKAPRGTRARKTASSARRSSAATTYSSGINHYDNPAADFGEDLNTMAWEGVGSAGYL